MKNVNKEVESERSDFSVLCRHHCPEVTNTELGLQPFQILLPHLQLCMLCKYIKFSIKMTQFKLFVFKN